MALSSITLSSFRCFNSLKVDLSSGANFFYGRNGSGKTSILEAIYLVCSGRSFKSSNIESAVKLGKESFKLKAYDNDSGFIIEAYKERSKAIQLKLNNKKITISEAAKTFPATIIDNKTFSFTEAAPAFRRKILDRAVFLSDESYSANWFAYFRSLKQRNKLLKERQLSSLEPWTEKLASLGESLTEKRKIFFDQTKNEFGNIINKLDLKSHKVFINNLNVNYDQGWDSTNDLLTTFNSEKDTDIRRKVTTKGPHKADIKIFIENTDAKEILSRGEQKLLAIIWLCSQHEVLRSIYNIKPTLLIDDVKSELDIDTFNIYISLLKLIQNQVIFSNIEDQINSKIEAELINIKKFHVEQLSQ